MEHKITEDEIKEFLTWSNIMIAFSKEGTEAKKLTFNPLTGFYWIYGYFNGDIVASFNTKDMVEAMSLYNEV